MQDLISDQRVRRRARTWRPAAPAPQRPAVGARRAYRPEAAAARSSARHQPILPPLPALRLPPRLGRAVLALLGSGLVAAAAACALYSLAFRPAVGEPAADPLAGAGLEEYVGAAAAIEGEAAVDPLAVTESFGWTGYTVAAGDTVSSIAAARGLSIDSLIALNGVDNVKRLRVGAELRVPNMDGVPYSVRPGDSLGRIAKAWGIPLAAILDANDLESDQLAVGMSLFLPGARMRADELKRALGELFVWPLVGRLTSNYGWRNDPISGVRRFHAAIDIALFEGAPIKAAMAGTVVSLGVSPVYGKFIILKHDGGYQTLYAHLKSTAVAIGAKVRQSGVIAYEGSTGYSTGPHLHFAVYKNGKAMNPLQFLE